LVELDRGLDRKRGSLLIFTTTLHFDDNPASHTNKKRDHTPNTAKLPFRIFGRETTE
jgi:hypothetical protein